jgi:hypothetical protein
MRQLSFTVEEATVAYGSSLRSAREAWGRYCSAVDAGETELARVAYLERERLRGEAENAGEKLRTLLESDA